MKHRIDPKIDCVFKAILGTTANSNLLIHFLNAILKQEFEYPIKSVEILNPYNDKEFINDKLSIVDVKASDDFGHLYQIEIQLNCFNYLPQRMIYNWADIYSNQLTQGEHYSTLKPTYSIWLFAENLLQNDSHYAHNYQLRDQNGQALNKHGGIGLLELNKFNVVDVKQNDHRWLKFFKEGSQLDDPSLPNWMQTDKMRQAMNTLSIFSEKEREYDRYQARQEYLRIQRSNQFMFEQEREAKLKARSTLKQAVEEKKATIQREKNF
ncbi:MAG: Rpn family recombination-promoting nuclease/putative transposase [Methylococcales bacterium]|nr:Rpn family recombination-promoting nuclease/putative transposase [Methylococcales bacterium]